MLDKYVIRATADTLLSLDDNVHGDNRGRVLLFDYFLAR